MDSIREALKQRPNKTCAIMLDTTGPEIRTGLLRDNKPVDLVAGQELLIVTDTPSKVTARELPAHTSHSLRPSLSVALFSSLTAPLPAKLLRS